MMNKNKYYPIFLNLTGLPCLIVGGGKVAERKMDSLLSVQAQITIVALDITPGIKERIDNQGIRWIKGKYKDEYLQGMRLVICATDNYLVNQQVYNAAGKRGIPVNCVDDIKHCSFIVPAIARKGEIQIAVSTGGGAPGVAGLIRDRLNELLEMEWDILVDYLKNHRHRIVCLESEAKRKFWQAIKKLDISLYKNKKDKLIKYVEDLLKQVEKPGDQ